MISSKAWRCSRSRRRSSAAMCRFQGGKPAARSPDAISAERRGRQHRGDAGGWVGPAAGRERSHNRGSRGRRPTPAMAPRPSSVRGPRSAAARRNGDSGCPRRRLAPPPRRQPSPPRAALRLLGKRGTSPAAVAAGVAAATAGRAGALLRRGGLARRHFVRPPHWRAARCRHLESGELRRPPRAAIWRGRPAGEAHAHGRGAGRGGGARAPLRAGGWRQRPGRKGKGAGVRAGGLPAFPLSQGEPIWEFV